MLGWGGEAEKRIGKIGSTTLRTARENNNRLQSFVTVFTGKMMRCSDLPWLIQFIVMFYNDKPGDWLLDGMIETKACNLEKDQVSTRAKLGTEFETEI